MTMQFIDLAAQQARIGEKLHDRIRAVLAKGDYIMGKEVAEFEAGLSTFCGAKHVISCANGTDALLLAMMALDVKKDDAVFCPSFTFAATAEMVPFFGAVPVFVDVLPDTFNIDPASLTRAIQHARTLGLNPVGVVPVDLFGLPADYDAIEAIAAEHGLWIMADSAQGFGGVYKGRTTGSIGRIATTSFFPAKPLGCYGDGGAIFTDDDEIAKRLQSYRVHGKGAHKYDNERLGMNSRLDTLQAAILLEKLAIYPDEIEKRQVIAARYSSALANAVGVPHVPEGLTSVWAQYTILLRDEAQRDGLAAHLKSAGIPTAIYYPRPLHRQTAYGGFPVDPNGMAVSESHATRVLSLPMHPYLDEPTQRTVIDAIIDYVK